MENPEDKTDGSIKKGKSTENLIELSGTAAQTGSEFGDPDQRKDTVRSSIAVFYVYAFFGIIFITFLVGMIQRLDVKQLSELLLAVSGILSGPLGFIIGYYFKSADK